MADGRIHYNRGVVRPVQCITEGLELIKPYYWLFVGITLVGNLIAGAVPLGILHGPMMCGIYIALFKANRGREPKFEHLFQGFDYFAPSLVATLLWMVPMAIIIAVAYAGMFAAILSGPPTGLAKMIGLLLLFYSVVLAVALAAQLASFFVYELIVYHKLSGVEAFKLSLAAVVANLGGVLGLMALCGIMVTIGLFACCIGVVFVAPIVYAATAVAYLKVFSEKVHPASADLRDFDDE